MYAYWAIFDDPQNVSYISGQSCLQIYRNFGTLFEGGTFAPDCCIAYFCQASNGDRNCFELHGIKIVPSEETIRISFDSAEEIELESNIVRKGIYRLAKVSDWIAKTEKYAPNLCIMERPDFDRVRKGSGATSKHTSISEEVARLKQGNQWTTICALFEPLDRLEQDNPYDIWNSDGDLSELAFACSKLGEFQAGKGKDGGHLSTIKRYREICIRIFQRCEELSPDKYRYPSSLGYRHYLNVIELTQPRGRRDGNADEEIQRALDCFGKALALRPDGVKDLYRAAKVLEIKLERYQYAKQRSWSSEELRERDKFVDQVIDFAQRAVDAYHALPEDSKSFNKREYVKALYTLASILSEKIDYREKDFIRARIFNEPKSVFFDPNDNYIMKEMQDLVTAKEAMEECCKAELPEFFEKPLEDGNWAQISERWAQTATVKFYRLGLIHLKMFYIKIVNADERNQEELRANAEKYLRQAGRIGDALRARGSGAPSTWYIKERQAWLHVLCGEPEQAVRLLCNARDSYVKNTYAIALMLTSGPARLKDAEVALKETLADRYNLASSWSATLLCWLYELTGQEAERHAVIEKYAHAMAKTYLRLLSLSPEEQDEG